jgi:hypothetical protein
MDIQNNKLPAKKVHLVTRTFAALGDGARFTSKPAPLD